MSFEEFASAWSAHHGGAPVTGITKNWLKISYRIAGLTPHASLATLMGLIFGIMSYFFAGDVRGVIYLVLSLIADGLDGSIAIRHEKASEFGAVLDSVVDRIVEFAWALAFIKLGAPAWLVAVAWFAASIQEYLRARLGGVGIAEIMKVTVAERPVRASLLFVAMIASLLHLHFIYYIALTWALLQVWSLFSVARGGFARLH